MFYWHHTILIPDEEEFSTSGNSLLEVVEAAIEVSAPLEGHNT